MDVKKGVLLIGGEAPDRSHICLELDDADCIVAADSGFDICAEYGIEPDLLVGDMDSLRDWKHYRRFPSEKIRRYPQDKDETDTELGIRSLIESGCGKLILIGGGGGRLDHLLAIVALFHREKPPAVWYTRNEKIQLIDSSVTIENRKGEEVSFFPVGMETVKIRSEGLKWELSDLSWNVGAFGISNVFDRSRCLLEPVSGKMIMIHRL